MAAIAHILVVIPFWGLIGAIIIWATQKKESQFVAYQSLQAIIYQLISVLVGFVFGCYILILTMYLIFPSMLETRIPEPVVSGLILCPSIVGWLLILAYVVYGVWGGISVLRGHNFHYLIIGVRLEQFLRSREVKKQTRNF